MQDKEKKRQGGEGGGGGMMRAPRCGSAGEAARDLRGDRLVIELVSEHEKHTTRPTRKKIPWLVETLGTGGPPATHPPPRFSLPHIFSTAAEQHAAVRSPRTGHAPIPAWSSPHRKTTRSQGRGEGVTECTQKSRGQERREEERSEEEASEEEAREE